MPDYPSDEELGLNPEVVESLDPNLREEIRKSRTRLKEANEWRARAESAERQIAVRDVGIDLSTKLGQMFLKSYEGEWTPEALKTEALQIPGLLPAEQGHGSGPTDDELAAQRRLAGAGVTTGAGGVDLQQQLLTDLSTATTPEQVMALIDQADPSLGVMRKGMQ
jgi:hypothetical protein